MLNWIGTVAKAIAAGATAFASAFAVAQADGITSTEWVTIVVATVVAAVAVWGVPNRATSA
jgi:hypothetical protein